MLLMPAAAALVIVAALLSVASTSPAPSVRPSWRSISVAPADTDSVRLARPAPADSDSVRLAQPAPADSDSVAAAPIDSFRLTRRYLKPIRNRREIGTDSLFGQEASALPPRQRPFMPGVGSYWEHETVMDSTSRFYTVHERVGDRKVRETMRMDAETYRRERLRAGIRTNWQDLVRQHEQQRARQEGGGGLGFNIDVPGGRSSAFSTIFGKPQVDLRARGEAQVHAGFNYRYSDQFAAQTGQAGSIDPAFKQDLRLGITGTIGDKLRVNVDWDTQSQFDYQNQLKLDYTGYEDDILQNVEAGNVLLQTPTTLINGGQKLFGIKSEFQFGGVRLTTIASQQEGQSNSLSLEGGVQKQEFELGPTEYDERKHFFLSYFFRNAWEDAHANSNTLTLQQGFNKIERIEVWRLQQTNQQDETRSAVAMVDLGEQSNEILEGNPRNYTQKALPAPGRDQYESSELENRVRPGNANPRTFFEEINLRDNNYQIGTNFKLLEPNQDYKLHENLGYISLNQRLKESQALAVAFEYGTTSGTVKIGDFLQESGGSTGSTDEDHLVLKLLRPTNLQPPSPSKEVYSPAWYLEMRNIYNLPGGSLNPSSFDLNIYYEPSGSTQQTTLEGLSTSERLLHQLGLDRQNSNGQEGPDTEFDMTPYTLDQQNGLVIFPYLEPFGKRLENVVREESGGDELLNKYVFNDLYLEKKSTAERNLDQNIYNIEGSYKGDQPSFYDLKAFSGLVEGSVRVTSNGTELQEGQDYVVDYQGGTVTITNPRYLSSGSDIQIDYEQNKLFNVQKKTLLGARADYKLGKRFSLGATAMRLTQRSPVDKFRVGEEPVSNTILGIDGSLELEPRWLTWAVDALPLVQTKAPSAISVSGEVAHLRPGHGETVAFERSREKLQAEGLDFKSDELEGISYIDDFEGFENTFSLTSPGSWHLSAAPVRLEGLPTPRPGLGDERTRSNWRASMGWYKLNQNIIQRLGDNTNLTAAVVRPPQKQVFPNKPDQQRGDNRISPFDVYFNPNERGPYNYNRNLQDFLNNPKQTWGGITLNLPEGYNDFNLKNIEFVEFVFKPYHVENASSDGRLVLDLGSVSEDVIPNGEYNREDGLGINDLSTTSLVDSMSRIGGGSVSGGLDISEDSPQRTEDLGLDGLASYAPQDYVTEDGQQLSEQAVYDQILTEMANSCTTAPCEEAVDRARQDPSGDDYHNYASDFFNGESRLQERFTHYFAGQELNSYESQDEVGPSERGNSRFPDGEDLNRNSSLDTDNSYFQYELPLAPDRLDELAANNNPDDYVINKISNESSQTSDDWYLVRIPVQKPTRNVGDKQDFSLVENLRLWTTGHRNPVTMRFATMELVGSQWRTSDRVSWHAGAGLPPFPEPPGADETRLSISSANNEENSSTYAPPLGTVRKYQSPSAGGSGRAQVTREQSLVMRVENLRPQQQRAIYKTFNQGLNLLKYSNLRMFVHMDGRVGGQLLRTVPEEAREHVKLFVRLGTNQTTDYYEYEQPLTPSEPTVTAGEYTVQQQNDLWQTNQPYDGSDPACPDRQGPLDLNSVNIERSALNQLKFVRNNRSAPRDSLFWSDRLGEDGEPIVSTCFAPPGTRLAVKGNPSLGKIETMVVGVRYDAEVGSRALRRLEVWINELRVAGYDQEPGWAGLANANIKLADFGTLRGNFRRRTSGFGSLNSTLGDRQQVNRFNWTLDSQFYLDKLLPARYGWRIPFSFQLSSNTSTPEFAPSRGDIRVSEILDQLDDSEARNDALRAAQKHRVSRSMSVSFSKSGSESFWVRNTLDGLSVSYSLSDRESRSPSQQRDDSWEWDASLDYKVSANPHTVSPFGFLEGAPVVGLLSDLALNYAPSSVRFGGQARRNYSASKDRPSPTPGASTLPPSVRYELRDQQGFTHKRNGGIRYSPFEFLSMNFDSNTNQSLKPLSADSMYSVVVTDSTGRRVRTISDARANNVEDTLSRGMTAYQRDSLNVVSTRGVANRLFSDPGDVHTKGHDQRFNTTLSLQFLRDLKWLDWIKPQDLNYSANYNWTNGAIGNRTGANISVNSNIKTGLEIQPQKLLRKFDFYTRMEEKQKKAEQREKQKQREAEAREQQNKNQQQGQGRQAPADTTAAAGGGQQKGAPSDSLSSNVIDDLIAYLPEPSSVLRRSVLAVTSVQNVSLNYTNNRSGSASNVGRAQYGSNGGIEGVEDGYGLWDAFQGNAPPLSYRFGFNRQLDPTSGFRVMDSTLRVQDELTNGNKLSANATVSPSDNLQINLTWNTEWDQRSSTTYSLDLNRQGCGFAPRETEQATQNPACIGEAPNRNGTNRASTWAFGGSYRSFFESQLEALRGDFQEDGNVIKDSLGNSDGRTVLTEETTINDFRSAYVTSFGAIDGRGLLPFPMPGWRITYSGISQWPFITDWVQRASLKHGYNATYQSGYRSEFSSSATASFPFANRQVEYDPLPFRISRMNVNEQFSPLVGLDISWNGNLQTSISWTKSNVYSFSPGNKTVGEQKQNKIQFNASYQRQGLNIPFLPIERLNNTIQFSVSASYALNDNSRYRLENALGEAAQSGPYQYDIGNALKQGSNRNQLKRSSRINVSPRISYTISNRVSADFTMTYEKLSSEKSQRPSTTRLDGGVNIRVSIQN